jgi:hypothetical protein
LALYLGYKLHSNAINKTPAEIIKASEKPEQIAKKPSEKKERCQ